MASEQIQAVIDKVSTKFSNADLSQFPEKFAIQINLTGKIAGVFYIEVLNGVLSIEPYEYDDRDVSISLTKTNLDKILDNKLKVETAFATKKLSVDGDLSKAAMIKNFL